MAGRRKVTTEDREAEKQIKRETSLSGNLWQLQEFLTGEKKDVSDIVAGKSYGGGHVKKSGSDDEDTVGGGLPAPKPYSMDVGSLAEKVGGIAPAPSGRNKASSSKAEYSLSPSGNWNLKRQASHEDQEENTDSSPHEAYFAPKQYSVSQFDINEMVSPLKDFAFSEDNRDWEIQEIRKTVAQVVERLKIQRIAESSKKAAKYSDKFFKTSSGGIKGTYSILGQKIAMTVEGSFTGDEVLYLTVEGDEPVGVVMKKDPYGQFLNISEKFKINVERI